MRLRSVLFGAIFVVVALVCTAAFAQQARPQISALEVEGNLRVESEAILRQVGLEIGEELDERSLGDAIRAVYALGFFDDIAIDAQLDDDGGLILTVIVTEKPSISEVTFVGNDELSNEDVDEVVDLRVGAILDEARVRANAEKIEDLYRDKGYYLVEVDYRLYDTAEGEVGVEYEIQEYTRVQVGRVTFVGNDNLDARELRAVMQTRPGDYLSFLTQFGNFARDDFAADLQRIRVTYYDNGYLDVAVGDPVIELSRDRRRLYITIPIDEGEVYTVSQVGVSGDLLPELGDPEEDLLVEAGSEFRASQVRGDIERLTRQYQDEGYAFTNVNMLTQQNADALEIGIEYDIDRGELVYIGRIDIIGNSITRDRVIRREMQIQEGELYSRTNIEYSEARITRLGFFDNVTIREQVSAIDPQLIDLEVEVSEQPTRSFQIGAGFSSVENFVATAQISENNFFGRGQSLSLNATLSSARQLFQLSFSEPYLFDSDWSAGMNLFNRQVAFTQFRRQSRGIDLNFGYRPFDTDFWRDLSFTVGYGIEEVDVIPGGLSGSEDVAFPALFDGGLTSSITTGVQLDRRNNRLFPSEGFYLAANVEIADEVLGSGNEFIRTRGIGRFYASPLWSGWVLKLNAELGHVASTSDTLPVPIFERFFVGGPNSVRGFERLSLSPTIPTGSSFDPHARTSDFLAGGNKELVFNLELEFPILTAVGIRGVLFADAGNAFAFNEPYTLRLDLFDDRDDGFGNVLRTAVGLGFRWRSPIGPLRFEWGLPLKPITDENGVQERPVVFEFSIGDPF